MDQVGERQANVRMDWDRAFDLYRKATASNNEDLQVQATIKLAKMSKYTPADVLMRCFPILLHLLKSPSSDQSTRVQEASAYCLKHIACQANGSVATLIGESGAIPQLLDVLSGSEMSLKMVLAKCLRNIVNFGEENRQEVVGSGGLEIVLHMLNASPGDLQQPLLETLSALALTRQARRVIFRSGCVSFLVESARLGSMISRTRAAQSMGLMGLVKRARRALLDSGAITVLIELLEVGDMSTKLVAGNALGILAPDVHYIRSIAQAGAIPLYAELLRGPDPMGKEIAEDVFCILAVVEENAVSILEHLVRILNEDTDEAKAAAADVIWDLSSYKYLQSVMRDSGAIPILVELLRSPNIDIREKVSGAISQLSDNEVDRLALAELGAVPLLVDKLLDESEEVRENAIDALLNFTEYPSLRDRLLSLVNDPYLSERFFSALDNRSFENLVNRVMQIHFPSSSSLTSSLRRLRVDRDPCLN